jgi:hypothetical protein
MEKKDDCVRPDTFDLFFVFRELERYRLEIEPQWVRVLLLEFIRADEKIPTAFTHPAVEIVVQ